jgi:esterase/lipase superfamily enzyme
MPKYWLISDRNNGGTGTGRNVSGLTYFVSDHGRLNDIANWQKVTSTQFRALLAAAADAFPALTQSENENQSHVTLLVHGFNVSFDHSTKFYEDLSGRLFDGADSLGLCILYDWPSLGSVVGYEPDRASARDCAGDLTDILSELFDWLIKKQQAAINSDGDPKKACKAKVSLIAHSMGYYVVQKAMAAAWTRKNQPLLVSLINRPHGRRGCGYRPL